MLPQLIAIGLVYSPTSTTSGGHSSIYKAMIVRFTNTIIIKTGITLHINQYLYEYSSLYFMIQNRDVFTPSKMTIE